MVESGVVGGQADSAAGEAGFEGVETDFGFAFFGGGAGGFLSVFAIGGELGFGDGGCIVAGGVVAESCQTDVGSLEVSGGTGGFAGLALGGAADRTVGHKWDSFSLSAKEKARQRG